MNTVFRFICFNFGQTGFPAINTNNNNLIMPYGGSQWNYGMNQRLDNIDQNFFAALNSQIVAPLKKSGADVGMNNETLLITKNHQGPGFIVLASDEKSGITPAGVNNIERLLDKG